MGSPVADVKTREPSAARPARDQSGPAAGGAPVTLAELETELTRRLLEEGAVVRGTDIARVVGLGVGIPVVWNA